MDTLVQFIINNDIILYPIVILGLIQLFKILYQLFVYVCKNLFVYNKNLSQRYGKGSWAVVTGCTEGIGQQFLYELAEQNFNLILISRNGKKLQNTALDVVKQFPQISYKIIVADFAQSDNKNLYNDIVNQIRDLDISMLVNNVGIGHGGKLETIEDNLIYDMLYINTFPIVFLTKKIIPLMMQRKRKSAIINLGSMAGRYPFSYLSVYSATKSFDRFFSKAIEQEYGNKIDIMCLTAGAVLTNRTSEMKEVPAQITPKQCVQGGLSKLGGTFQTAGHFKHALSQSFSLLLPDFIQDIIYKQTNISLWSDYEKKMKEKLKKQ